MNEQNVFTPGQPIGMNAAHFTPDLQQQIMQHHFDKSVPSGYAKLATEIMGQQTDPNTVQISREEYEQLKAGSIDNGSVRDKVNTLFANQPQPQYEQNPGIVNEPQPQSVPEQPARQANDPNDIMQRLFPPQPTQQPEQQHVSDPQPTSQPNQIDTISKVKETIIDICSSRQIDPEEFVTFASAVSMEDIADLYLAFKKTNMSGRAMEQVNPGQQQQQLAQPRQADPVSPSPINLSQIPPNPNSYVPKESHDRKVNAYWGLS